MTKNKQGRMILTNVTIFFMIVLLSITASLVLLLDSNRPSYYLLLPLLPFSFGFLCILFHRIFNKYFENLSYFIIISLYTVRNVITPLIMRFGGYDSLFTLLSFSNVNKAIALMIYETAVVFLFLHIMTIRNVKYKKSIGLHFNWYGKKMYLFGAYLFIFLIILSIIYVFVPEIKLAYKTIFDKSGIVGGFATNVMYSGRSINRILFTLFTFIFPFFHIYIGSWFICVFRKKIGENVISIILSFLIALTPLLFMSASDGFTILMIVGFGILIYKLYINKRRSIFLISIISILVGLVNIYILKTNAFTVTSNLPILQALSKMFQAYFPGVSNVAGIFNIDNPNKLSTLFFDFYEMIPFRNTLFGINGDKLVTIYTQSNMTVSQIIPCVGQAYHYLGFVLAPLVPCVFIYWAIKFEKLCREEKNIWKYMSYLFLFLYAALTPIMYNITIFGTRYLVTILPMILLSKNSGSKFTFDRISKIKQDLPYPD